VFGTGELTGGPILLLRARARAPFQPTAAGSRRVGGRRCYLSICHRRCPHLSPRVLTRDVHTTEVMRSDSRVGPACARSTDRWRRERDRAVLLRRRRRRRSAPRGAISVQCGASACGLTPTEEATAAATCAQYGSYLCSTPSSCDGVDYVFAFPTGARAIGRVGCS